MPKNQTAEDRRITRAIHRIFWRATLQDLPDLIITICTRFPSLFIYNMLIPLEIAYGLQAVLTKDTASVKFHAVRIVVYAIAYCVLWAIGGYAISRNGRRGSIWLQKEVFSNYLQKDYAFYNDAFVGALGSQATRLRDIFSDYCQIFLLSGPIQLSIILSGIVIVAAKSPLLAAVTAALMFLVLAFTLFSSRYRVKYRRRVGETSSVVSGHISDALTHAAAVKSFANEDYEAQRLDVSLQQWAKAQFDSWVSTIPADVGRMLSLAVVMSVLLLMTADLYRHGTISFAIVALVQLYVIRLISTAQAVAEIVKSYETAMGAAYQPIKTMLQEPVVQDQQSPVAFPKTDKLTIKINALTYCYPEAKKSKPAIRNYSLTIEPGERVGIVGYSGSGKTTLTKLLLRFMDPNAGSITLNGADIRQLSQAKLRQHIAYVPQEPILFHRSIAENITYANPTASKKQIQQAGKQAFVDEFVENLPQGYDTFVGERGVKLSGGQRQRVAIARALLKDAPILVLDEATSALDSQSERYIQEALWKLMKGRTAIVIAHRLSTIKRLDRIVVMDKGTVVQSGTHDELLADKQGIYARLWAHQTDGYLPCQ